MKPRWCPECGVTGCHRPGCPKVVNTHEDAVRVLTREHDILEDMEDLARDAGLPSPYGER